MVLQTQSRREALAGLAGAFAMAGCATSSGLASTSGPAASDAFIARIDAALASGGRWGTPLDHPWLPDGPSWNLRGNGGMISTSGDLAKWIHALQTGAILNDQARDKLFDIYVHRNRRGTRTMGAAGSNDVFNACYLWYLDESRLIIVLTSDNRVLAEQMVPDLAAKVRDLPST